MELLLIAHDGSPAVRSRAVRLTEAAPRLFGAGDRARTWHGSHAAAALVDDGRDCSLPIWRVDDERPGLMAGLTQHADTLDKLAEPGLQPALFGNDDPLIIVRAEAACDGLVIRNDGVGAIPAFVVVSGETLLFSTSLHLLAYLGMPAELDPQGVATYLATEHLMMHRTIYAGARMLAPGATASWSQRDGFAEAASGLIAAMSKAPHDGGASDLVERFAEAWPRVMSRLLQRTGGKPALSLSGGLDSRSIAIGLADADPICFTYGSVDDREVQVASRVARRLALRHLTLPINRQTSLQHSAFSLQALDGCQSPFVMYESWFRDDLAEIARPVVNGTTGDPYWGSASTAGLASKQQVTDLVRKELMGELRGVSGFLDETFRDECRRLLDQTIAESVEAIDDPDIGDVGTLWKLLHREQTWIWCHRTLMRRAGLQLEDPFHYRDFIEFAQRVPATLRQNGRLYLEVWRRCFPGLADLPRTNDAFPPSLITDHLYRGTLAQRSGQLATIAARSPRAAIAGGSFLATGLIDWLVRRPAMPPAAMSPFRGMARRHRPVFRHRELLRDDPDYRGRYLALLEEAIACAPAFVDRRRLAAAQQEARAGSLPLDPALLGRVISLCLWQRIATQHRAAGAAVERGALG